MDSKQIDVMVADASHEVYVDKILDTIREAAKVRGTGIAERTHEYVATKMKHRASSYIPITAAWDWPNVSRRLLSAWHACGGPKPRYSV